MQSTNSRVAECVSRAGSLEPLFRLFSVAACASRTLLNVGVCSGEAETNIVKGMPTNDNNVIHTRAAGTRVRRTSKTQFNCPYSYRNPVDSSSSKTTRLRFFVVSNLAVASSAVRCCCPSSSEYLFLLLFFSFLCVFVVAELERGVLIQLGGGREGNTTTLIP